MSFIVIEPDRDLEFHRPFTSVVKQSLIVTNNHPSEAIAFKVKTTAPKQYCVRPNSGKIAPGGSVEVQVLLQAMKEDPPLDYKCKDKFLIQCIKIPQNLLALEGDDLASQLQEIWSRTEQVKKTEPEAAAELIVEKKLRCNFLPPVDALNASGPAVEAAAPIARLPTTTKAVNNGESDRELREARDTIKRLTAACEGYKSEIERLNVLRQRRTVAGGASDNENPRTSPGQLSQSMGVNIQIVALIALIAFLLGVYLF